MSETERDGLSLLGWLQKNGLAVASILFACGVAYSQLNYLSTRLDETTSEIKQLRMDLVDLRINGMGVPRETHNGFVEHQKGVDTRQDREIAFLRDRLIKLRLDLQQIVMKTETGE